MIKGRKTGQLNKKSGTEGYTLVEVIVCFALIGLFMSAAVTVLTMYMETSYKLNSMNRTQLLTTTLMDTISGEVSSAAEDKMQSGGVLKMEIQDGGEDSDALYFTDKNGYPLKLFVESGRLMLKYTEPQGGDTDWGYGDGVYQGNEVIQLQFAPVVRVEGGPNVNLLEVTLTVRNKKTEYEETRKSIIQCYNLKDNQIGYR